MGVMQVSISTTATQSTINSYGKKKMSRSSSPSPPKHQPLPTPSTAATGPKPVPWTHEETLHLIQTYQSTWYSLNRTHLRSQHWEAVSAAVANLCSYPPSHPTLKSTSQCRHKMEKLRKRYRSDRKRILQGTLSVSPWPYYDLMDQLDSGRLPVKAAKSENEDGEDENEEEEERGVGGGKSRRVRSVDYILRRAGVVNRFAAAGRDGGARITVLETAAAAEEKRKRVGEGEEGRREKMIRGLAEEIRGMAEKYVGVEEVKMEMVRETERWRMDMERKRLDLIIDSQRKLVDSIAKAFGS